MATAEMSPSYGCPKTPTFLTVRAAARQPASCWWKKSRTSQKIQISNSRFLSLVRIKKFPYPLPIFLNDIFRSYMAAALQCVKRHCGSGGEFFDCLVRNVRIIFGVEHHDFCRLDFLDMADGIIKFAAAQLAPIFIR